MNLELKGRVALVTGASVGIGREIARVLAAEGAQVVATARREPLLEELAAEIAAAGDLRPLVIAQDLCAPEGPERIKQRVLGGLGRLDILVNNAGGSRPIPMDASEEQWDEALTLNLRSGLRLAHAFLPVMVAEGWGRIINLTATSEPRGFSAATSASVAMHGWAKGLSNAVGRRGITVNCVAPGRIMSEQIVERIHPTPEARRQFAEANIPMGYFGEPRDVAYLVAFLASPRARYVNGEVIHVDGGMHRYAF